MRTFADDVRHASRALAKNPGFAAVCLLTLALGIGINTAVYSLLHGTLLKPLPFPRADRVVILMSTWLERGWDRASVSIPEIEDVRERSSAFASLALCESRQSPTLMIGDHAERPRANYVSASYFSVLGAKAALGRTFLPEDDHRAGGRRVVVLSHELWHNRLGGKEDVIGSKVLLSGEPYTVIGVMPPEFQDLRGDLDRSELWLPLSTGTMFFGNNMYEARSGRQYIAVARLKDGVTQSAAQAELDRIAKQLAVEYPYHHEGRGFTLISLYTWNYGYVVKPIWTLVGGAVVVLLLCCVNLGALLTIRGRARKQEIAVRAALGAGRGRLVAQTLTESLLLAVLGGGLGIFLAYLMSGVWTASGAFYLPAATETRIGAGVLAAAVAATLLVGLLIGLVPAMALTRHDLRSVFQATGRQVAGGGRRWAGFHLLVIFEVALAVVLLVGAGLMTKSLVRLTGTPLGFDTRNLLTMRLDLSGDQYAENAAVSRFTEELTDRLQAVPGVVSAVVWGPSMLGEASFHWRFSPEGMAPDDPRGRVMALRLHTSPGSLRALGIPLLRGRDFTRDDRRTGPPYAVVMDQRLAAYLWPGQDALGKHFYLGERTSEWGTVIGIARTTRHSGRLANDESVAGDAYTPLAVLPLHNLSLLLRYQGSVADVLKQTRQAVAELDPALVLFDTATMEERLREGEAGTRFMSALMMTYAAIALLLAVLGTYGVLAYSVQQRTGEIAIRSVLGAEPRGQLLMVLRQGLAAVSVGLGAGLLAAALLSRYIESLLFEVGRVDLVIYVAISLLMAGVGLVACYVPAHRASTVDPLVALRNP